MSEFIINPANNDTVDAFVSYLDEAVQQGAMLKINVKTIKDRSLSQNALLHIWVREYAAMRFNKNLKQVDKDDEDSVKIIIKQACYRETRHYWLCKKVVNVDTGMSATVLKSTREYDKGEMFMFMEFFQMFAGEKGLILEAMGEYGRLRDETNQ